MKKATTNMMALGAIGAVSLASIGTVSAVKNPETREAVRSAIENQDYAAFQEAAPEKKLEVIDTEEKFNKVVEMHNLRESGDREAARAIADELGLKKRGKGGHRNPEARAAVESGDWSAFQEATADKKFGEKIDTQEKFNRLIEANQLRKDGNHEEARAIMDELGFEKRGHRGRDKH